MEESEIPSSYLTFSKVAVNGGEAGGEAGDEETGGEAGGEAGGGEQAARGSLKLELDFAETVKHRALFEEGESCYTDTVHRTLYTVHCTPYTIHRTPYTVHLTP